MPGAFDIPIIVCPLRFEAAALRRAMRDGPCDMHCCGPGTHAVDRWADGEGSHIERGRRVVLAGLAGSLRDHLRAGSAVTVCSLLDAIGNLIAEPPLRSSSGIRAAVVCVEAPVCTARQRREIAERSGADLADMESAAFARIANARGWRWGIVRGISDDPATQLPPEATSWVDAAGRTRLLRVLGAMASSPGLLREAPRLRRDARQALFAAGAQLRALLAAPQGEGPGVRQQKCAET